MPRLPPSFAVRNGAHHCPVEQHHNVVAMRPAACSGACCPRLHQNLHCGRRDTLRCTRSRRDTSLRSLRGIVARHISSGRPVLAGDGWWCCTMPQRCWTNVSTWSKEIRGSLLAHIFRQGQSEIFFSASVLTRGVDDLGVHRLSMPPSLADWEPLHCSCMQGRRHIPPSWRHSGGTIRV